MHTVKILFLMEVTGKKFELLETAFSAVFFYDIIHLCISYLISEAQKCV